MLRVAILLALVTMSYTQDPPPPPPSDLTGIPGEALTSGIDPLGTGRSGSTGDSSTIRRIVFTPELRRTMEEFGVTEAELQSMLEQQKRTGKPATLTVIQDGVEKTITWDFSQLQSTLGQLGLSSLPDSSSSTSSSTSFSTSFGQSNDGQIRSSANRGSRLSGSVSSGVGSVRRDGVGTVDIDRGTFSLENVDPIFSRTVGDSSTPLISQEVSRQIDGMIERINRLRQDLFRRRPSLTEQQYAIEEAKVEEEERRLRKMIMQENMRARQPLVVDPVRGGTPRGKPRDLADVTAIRAREQWERELAELRRIQDENRKILQELNREARVRAESRARLDRATQRSITDISGQMLKDGTGQAINVVDPFTDSVSSSQSNTRSIVSSARRNVPRVFTDGRLPPGRNTLENTESLSPAERLRIEQNNNGLRQEYESLRQQLLRTEAELRALDTRPMRGLGQRGTRDQLSTSGRPLDGLASQDFDQRSLARERRPPSIIPDYTPDIPQRVDGIARGMQTTMPGVRRSTIGRISGITHFPYINRDIPRRSMTSSSMLSRTLPGTSLDPYAWDRNAGYINQNWRQSFSTSGMINPWYRRFSSTGTDPRFTSRTQTINYFQQQVPQRRRVTF